MQHPLDPIVSMSLMSFGRAVSANGWAGREREAISYFVMGHLLPLCAANTAFFDPTQVGIECPFVVLWLVHASPRTPRRKRSTAYRKRLFAVS